MVKTTFFWPKFDHVLQCELVLFLENFLFFRRIFVFGVFLIDQNWKNQVLNIGNCSLSVSPWFPQKISKIYFEISEYINFFQKKKFLQKKSQQKLNFFKIFWQPEKNCESWRNWWAVHTFSKKTNGMKN